MLRAPRICFGGLGKLEGSHGSCVNAGATGKNKWPLAEIQARFKFLSAEKRTTPACPTETGNESIKEQGRQL